MVAHFIIKNKPDFIIELSRIKAMTWGHRGSDFNSPFFF